MEKEPNMKGAQLFVFTLFIWFLSALTTSYFFAVGIEGTSRRTFRDIDRMITMADGFKAMEAKMEKYQEKLTKATENINKATDATLLLTTMVIETKSKIEKTVTHR